MVTPKFSYKRRDPSSTKKRTEQWGNERDSYLKDHVPVWKPQDGENVIRILPPSWDGAEYYGIDIYVHFNVGPDNASYLDLYKMKKMPDPITEEVQKARQDNDVDYAKELDSKKRVLVYLIDRDKPKQGPMLWAMPWTVDKEIAIHSWNGRTQEALLIDSPEDGFDIIVNRQGKDKKTEYTVKIDRNPSPLIITNEIASILEEFPLPECLNYYSYEHIQEVFLGGTKKADDRKSSPKKETKSSERPKHNKVNLTELSWDDVHNLKSSELDKLVEQIVSEMAVDVSVFEVETDEDLAQVICDELSIKKPTKIARRGSTALSYSLSVEPTRSSHKEEEVSPPRRSVKLPKEEEPEETEESDEEEDEQEETPPPKPAKLSYKERLAGINQTRQLP